MSTEKEEEKRDEERVNDNAESQTGMLPLPLSSLKTPSFLSFIPHYHSISFYSPDILLLLLFQFLMIVLLIVCLLQR